MFWQVKRIAQCPWPAIEQFAFPLNGSEGAKVPLCSRNQIVLKDAIQFTHSPPICMIPRQNTQSVSINIADPLRQFCWQPAKNGMCCPTLIHDPLASRLIVVGSVANHLLVSGGVCCSNISPYSGGFQQMNIQALFATVVMTGATIFATCLSLGPAPVSEKSIMKSYMKSYMTKQFHSLPE
jgi:hypothetical protein